MSAANISAVINETFNDGNNTHLKNFFTEEPINKFILLRDSFYVVMPITAIYSIILFTGVIGNIVTCIVIVKNKFMHTATNYYLFSLAISDLLLLISGLPPEMYRLWWPQKYIFGDAFCIIQSFSAETSANATVLTITAFTVERYIAICHPFLSHTMSKLSRAVKFVIAIWFVALCLAIPQAIQYGVDYSVDKQGNSVSRCTITHLLVKHAFELSTIVFFVTPMTIITVLYMLIAVKLRTSRISTGLYNDNDNSVIHRNARKSAAQNRIIKMLVAVVIAFFVCWAPFHAQRLLAIYISNEFNSDQPPNAALLLVYQILDYVSGVLYFVSTSVNPFVYNIMSHKFRSAFMLSLPKLCVGAHRNLVRFRSYSRVSRYQTQTSIRLQQYTDETTITPQINR